MNAVAVLSRLAELGITACAEDGMVLIRPASKVPPELKANFHPWTSHLQRSRSYAGG